MINVSLFAFLKWFDCFFKCFDCYIDQVGYKPRLVTLHYSGGHPKILLYGTLKQVPHSFTTAVYSMTTLHTFFSYLHFHQVQLLIWGACWLSLGYSDIYFEEKNHDLMQLLLMRCTGLRPLPKQNKTIIEMVELKKKKF